MSLAFLAKKSWHTSNLRNVEKVWIAEQKHAAEEKKLAELKKNIEEERQMQELRKLQAAHGNKSATVERLDWMYQGPMASNPNERSAEEFLLGKEYKPENAGSDARKLGDSAYGALAMSKPVLPSNDAFSRLNEDPMMLIRSQQKRAQEDILKNPVKMKKIKGQVEKILKDKKEKKKAKKAKKKERKHGKKDKARRSRSASVDSAVSRRSDESLRGPEREERRSRHDKSPSPRRHYRQDARSHHHRSRSPERDERSRRQERPFTATGRERRREESTRSRSRSPARRANRGRSKDRHDIRRLPSRSRSRDRFRTDRQRRSSSRDSFGRELASPRHRSRQRERSPDRGRYRNRSRTPERRSRDDNHSKRDDRRRADSGKPKETESRRPRSRSNERHESGTRRDYVVKKPDDGGKYGLIHREGAVEAKDIDTSTLGPNSKFLEKAREKKRQEEDELRQKLSKSTRTTSKMSHEEMVQEAARMAADAKAREEYLMKQATAKREKLDEEEAKLRKDPQFLKQLQDSAYVKGDSSMADRIRRNSHYIQKRAGAGNFLSKD